MQNIKKEVSVQNWGSTGVDAQDQWEDCSKQDYWKANLTPPENTLP